MIMNLTLLSLLNKDHKLREHVRIAKPSWFDPQKCFEQKTSVMSHRTFIHSRLSAVVGRSG